MADYDDKAGLLEGMSLAHAIPTIDAEGLEDVEEIRTPKRQKVEYTPDDEQDPALKLDYFFHLVCSKDVYPLDDASADIEATLGDFDQTQTLENKSHDFLQIDGLDLKFAEETPESYFEARPPLSIHEESMTPPAAPLFEKQATPGLTKTEKSVRQTRQPSPSNSATTENARTWSYSEEVHFVGAVFMALTEKGSLFPNSRKRVRGGKSIRQGESDTWATVEKYFIQMKAESSEQYRRRSATALCRHFKHMKSRLEKKNSSCMEYLESWLKKSGCETLGETIQLPIQVKWNPSRLGNWSPIEEIVLVGAAVQRFMQRGSLCNKDGKWCWDEVKSIFDASFQHLAYNKRSERSGAALQHHFKVLKKRLAREGKSSLLNAGSPCTQYRFRSYFWAYVMLMEGESLKKLVQQL